MVLILYCICECVVALESTSDGGLINVLIQVAIEVGFCESISFQKSKDANALVERRQDCCCNKDAVETLIVGDAGVEERKLAGSGVVVA